MWGEKETRLVGNASKDRGGEREGKPDGRCGKTGNRWVCKGGRGESRGKVRGQTVTIDPLVAEKKGQGKANVGTPKKNCLI